MLPLLAQETSAAFWVIVIPVACVGVGGIIANVAQIIIAWRERKAAIETKAQEKKDEAEVRRKDELVKAQERREGQERELARIERERLIAEKVAEVAVKTEEGTKALTDIAKLGESTHKLVNSHYGNSLYLTLLANQSNLASLRTILILRTGTDEEAAARLAVEESEKSVKESRRLYDSHQRAQAEIDSAKAAQSVQL